MAIECYDDTCEFHEKVEPFCHQQECKGAQGLERCKKCKALVAVLDVNRCCIYCGDSN